MTLLIIIIVLVILFGGGGHFYNAAPIVPAVSASPAYSSSC
jgi:hypothetical protein